jgi:hypothetical protein
MEIIDLSWQKEIVKCTQDIEHTFETGHADKRRLTHTHRQTHVGIHTCMYVFAHTIFKHIYITHHGYDWCTKSAQGHG